MSTLYVVATPIGNLEDVSRRALRILSEVDLILSEDTRVTKKLLDHYQIKTPTLSYHQHSKLQKTEYIINLLKEGKNLALVSDAGTPGISDPGNKLINATRSVLVELRIIPVPGPSVITAAASISGFPMDKFIFLSFPPTKRKRKKFFEEIANSKYSVIFYESPYRIIKTLKELSSLIAEASPHLSERSEGREMNEVQRTSPHFASRGSVIENREVMVCRELTKKFETIYRGKIKEVIKEIEKDKIKGEFVVIVEGKK